MSNNTGEIICKRTLPRKRRNLSVPCRQINLLSGGNTVKHHSNNHRNTYFLHPFEPQNTFAGLIATIRFSFNTHSTRHRAVTAA